MKIVISRKGFDGVTGGVPSPIFEDDRLSSLPIPYKKGKPYNDISIRHRSQSPDLGKIVEDLTKGKILGCHTAHLDPDLDAAAIARLTGWRGIFGQSGAAQGGLDNNNVGEGDLFLFFGRFGRVELDPKGVVQSVRGQYNKHVLFGWLRIDAKYTLPSRSDPELPLDALPTWARYHPHVIHSDLEARPNAIYTATDKLDPNLDLPGCGLFPNFRSELCLTHPDQPLPSLWRLPSWMNPWRDLEHPRRPPTQLTNQNQWSGSNDQFANVNTNMGKIGQEIIYDADAYPEAWPWAKALIAKCCGLAQ